MKRLISTVAAALLLAILAMPAWSQQDGKKQFVRGLVQSINHVQQTISVGGQTFELGSEALTVVIRGQESDIEEIAEKDMVVVEFVTYSDPPRQVAVKVTK